MKAVLMVFALAAVCGAQQIDLGQSKAKHSEVELVSDSARIPAGATVIPVWFRVRPGLHINSHEPKDELLMPTELKLDDATELHVQRVEFPPGKRLHLAVGAGEDVDVYSDRFLVNVFVHAVAGQHMLNGSLKYQACDAASCFPPRSLPVHLMVDAYLEPR